MRVVYGFTNSFYSDNIKMLDVTIKLFELSVKAAKRFHEVTIYTDEKSIDIVPQQSSIEILPGDYVFIDDFKIQLLQHTNDVIIDPDLILYKKLNLSQTVDASFEFKQKTYNKFTRPQVKQLIEAGVEKILPNFSEVKYMPNIGVLKINNQKLLTKYVETYNKLRTFILSLELNNYTEFSIILGQYVLGYLLMNDEFNVEYVNKKNNYVHFNGGMKFEPNFIIPKLNKPAL